jgi:hypothetical protein
LSHLPHTWVAADDHPANQQGNAGVVDFWYRPALASKAPMLCQLLLPPRLVQGYVLTSAACEQYGGQCCLLLLLHPQG